MPKDISVRIDKPGLYQLANSVYHGDCCDGPSISSTGLRRIHSEGLSVYWASSLYNPKAQPQESTDALRIGEAAHLLLLEPERVKEQLAVCPFDSYRTNDAKQWRADAEGEGRTVVSAAEFETLKAMRDALDAEPKVRGALSAGRAEQSLIWKDETGVWKKGRPDFLPSTSGRLVTDYKTTAKLARWEDDALIRYRYDMQAQLILEGARQLCDIEPIGFLFIVQEKTAPFRVRLRYLKIGDKASDEILKRASIHNRIACDRFAGAIASGEWEDPSPTLATFSETASKWARERIEMDLAEATQ